MSFNSPLIWLFIAILVNSSCDTRPEKPKKNDQVKSISFNLGSLDYPSFQSVPVDARCEGIQKFLQTVVDETSDLNFSEFNCKKSPSFEFASVEFSFRLSRNEEFINLHSIFQIPNKEATISLSEGANGQYTVLNPELLKDGLQADMKSLVESYSKWMASKEGDSSIAGESYADFVTRFIANFSQESAAPLVESPFLKIQLQVSAEAFSEGLAKIQEVAPEYFNGVNKSFLGCLDQACLSSSDIRFRIIEDYLVIERSLPQVEGQKQTAGQFFQIKPDQIKE